MSKVLLDLRQEVRDIKVIYPNSLDIDQCAKLAQGPVVEHLWRKPHAVVVAFMDPEALDQGKQTKRVHAREGAKHRVSDTRTSPDSKGVMEMGNGGDVPGVTYQGACVETARVEGKVGDNYLDDLEGKPGGGGTSVW